MDKFSAPAYSLARRFPANHESAAPGPSAYNQDSSVLGRRSPVCLLGKAARLAPSRNQLPGPGAYDADYDSVFRNSRTISFGSKKGSEKATAMGDGLGPGAYNIHNQLVQRKSPMFSLAGRHEEANTNVNPGPGAYNCQGSSLPRHKTAIGRARRLAQQGKQTPGPGAYTIESEGDRSSKGLWMGVASRNQSNRPSMPGPGQYEVVKAVKPRSGFSIGRRTKFNQTMMTPGPGMYTIDLRSTGKSFRFGTAGFNHNQTADIMPGPGQYFTTDGTARQTRQGPFMPRAKRRPNYAGDIETPGPGQYSPSSERKGARFSIPKNDFKRKQQGTPGPGQYEPYDSRPRTTSRFATSRRFMEERGDGVGPGAYEIGAGGSPGVKFGREERSASSKGLEGPGYYSIPSVVSNLPQYARKH